jgi:two-component system, response regulator
MMSNGGVTGGKIEILLVEDNPADITIILNSLKKANICNHVHVLRGGKELLQHVFQSGGPSAPASKGSEVLVFLSLKLPDAQGLDILRKLKGDERTKALPVIVLTSSQQERGVMESYKLGANACIVKPLDLAKLVEAVAELRLGWLLLASDDSKGT